MAIVGGAVLTPAMGWLSEHFEHVAPAYCVPLVAYVFIAFYAFFGATRRVNT
jgi:FHS family L-fucose permease-like MFS transporter